jgi:hypothetical protein
MNSIEKNKIIDECIDAVAGLIIAYKGINSGDSEQWDNAIGNAVIELEELKE